MTRNYNTLIYLVCKLGITITLIHKTARFSNPAASEIPSLLKIRFTVLQLEPLQYQRKLVEPCWCCAGRVNDHKLSSPKPRRLYAQASG
jgi:hypothetical protein